VDESVNTFGLEMFLLLCDHIYGIISNYYAVDIKTVRSTPRRESREMYKLSSIISLYKL
jgi:hypothetical protein